MAVVSILKEFMLSSDPVPLYTKIPKVVPIHISPNTLAMALKLTAAPAGKGELALVNSFQVPLGLYTAIPPLLRPTKVLPVVVSVKIALAKEEAEALVKGSGELAAVTGVSSAPLLLILVI